MKSRASGRHTPAPWLFRSPMKKEVTDVMHDLIIRRETGADSEAIADVTVAAGDIVLAVEPYFEVLSLLQPFGI
jgi:hypothetical protein